MCLIMLVLVPALSAADSQITFGWDVFFAWDAAHYFKIVTEGYASADGGLSPQVAFFPLFPGIVKAIASVGIPVIPAGVLVNSWAFLGAVLCLYRWVSERYSVTVARWVTAVLVWCPFSIFGLVFYTEGIFLLFSIAALAAFDRQQYVQAAIWGACSTLTRIVGMALIPAFLIVAWRERRSPQAYVVGLSVGVGLLAYMSYCWVTFSDPLAFISVQHQFWERSRGFNLSDWLMLVQQVAVGPVNSARGLFADPWYPVGMAAIVTIAAVLWRKRKAMGDVRAGSCLFVLFVVAWLIAGDPFVNLLTIWGGIAVLWLSRRSLGLLLGTYAAFSVAIILASGAVTSAERYIYAIVPVAIALGEWLSRHRRWGYAVFSFFSILLVTFSIRFAQNQWVA